MSDQPPDGPDPDPPAANTAGGKARATDMPYHDEKRLGDETPFYRRWALPLLLIIGVAAVAALFFMLEIGQDDEPTNTTTETTAPLTTTTTTIVDNRVPGDPCEPDDDLPDCIDPDLDGEFTYIPGGEACLPTAADSIDCADNDGDGDAGPPLELNT